MSTRAPEAAARGTGLVLVTLVDLIYTDAAISPR